MKPIDQIYRERLALLAKQHGTKAALAARLEKNPSQISQWINASKDSRTGVPRAMDRKTAREIEQKLGLPDGWMDQPISDPQAPVSDDTDKPSIAQPMSHLRYETVSSITWEQLVSEDRKGALPQSFRVGMPDNSMTPRVPQGAMLVMSTTERPQPGDGVLIKDKAGSLYFRQYRETRPGSWEAYAFNQAYGVLESARDGLEVLAVMIALESRGL